jgi:hypothetical protein
MDQIQAKFRVTDQGLAVGGLPESCLLGSRLLGVLEASLQQMVLVVRPQIPELNYRQMHRNFIQDCYIHKGGVQAAAV